MENYDPASVSKGFLAAAEEAERYLREVRGKLKTNSAYQSIYDDHLAKFSVYNYLHGRASLASRDSLLVELAELKNIPSPLQSEAFVQERFERHRQAYLEQIEKRYSGQVQGIVS